MSLSVQPQAQNAQLLTLPTLQKGVPPAQQAYMKAMAAFNSAIHRGVSHPSPIPPGEIQAQVFASQLAWHLAEAALAH